MDKLARVTQRHAEIVYQAVLEQHKQNYKRFLAKVDRQAKRCNAWDTLPKEAKNNLINGIKKLLKRKGIK